MTAVEEKTAIAIEKEKRRVLAKDQLRFHCERCNYTFEIPKISFGGRVSCPGCGGPTDETLESKNRRLKLNVSNKRSDEPLGRHPYDCPGCSKTFRSKAAMIIHAEEAHGLERHEVA